MCSLTVGLPFLIVKVKSIHYLKTLIDYRMLMNYYRFKGISSQCFMLSRRQKHLCNSKTESLSITKLFLSISASMSKYVVSIIVLN